jgi:hypothetical protein
MPRHRQPASPFRYFNSPPEVIRLVVMMYVKHPVSCGNELGNLGSLMAGVEQAVMSRQSQRLAHSGSGMGTSAIAANGSKASGS